MSGQDSAVLCASQPHRIKFRIRIKCSASDIQNVIDAFIESAMTSNEKDHRAADDDADMADNNRGDDDLAASLPDEILDYVLSLVSAYGDVRRCSLVCKRWHKAVARVAAKARDGLAGLFCRVFPHFLTFYHITTVGATSPSLETSFEPSIYNNQMNL